LPDLSISARVLLWLAIKVASAAIISMPIVIDTMNSISVRPAWCRRARTAT
jgi:hypothetical protein